MASEVELQIDAGTTTGSYVIRVLRAASGGEPTAVMQLNVDKLLAGRDSLEKAVLLSTVSARRALPVEEEQLRTVGQELFESLFAGPINSVYRASLMVAQQEGQRLRIVLRLNAPELAALPWEALWDPEVGAYTCMREPLVRHVPAPYTLDPLEVVPPIRILGIAASPRGLPEIDVAAEQEHLLQALQQPLSDGLIELHWLPQATWQAVHSELLADQWHALHFVGHGDYDIATEQGRIAFVGQDGRKDLVEAERLATLLGEAEPTPRLVVLNSCSSGEEGTGDLFSGTAAAIVRSGISAVAAMQFTVSDEAALRFARGFYTALAHGRDVAAALRAGRIEILGAARSLEWVTPVLYLRGENTRLFDLRSVQKSRDQSAGVAGTAPQRREGQTPGQARPDALTAQAHAIYLQARAELRAKHYDVAISLFDELEQLRPSYRDSAVLRAEATNQFDLAEKYQRANEAETSGNWLTAAQIYSEIVEADPAYRDAMARREICEKKQQILDLQSELRYHAEVQNWDAVIAVNDELRKLDPAAADLDGAASRARQVLQKERQQAELTTLYARALASEHAMDWASASRDYQAILAIDPAYRDTQERAEASLARRTVMDRKQGMQYVQAEIAPAAAPPGAPAEHKEGPPALSETLGYLGGMIGVVVLSVIVANNYQSISLTGGLVLAGAVWLLPLGAGCRVPAARSAWARRLRSALWGGSTVSLFITALVVFGQVLDLDVGPDVLVAGTITTAYAAVLWRLHRTAVQHVFTFVFLMLALLGLSETVVFSGGAEAWLFLPWIGSLVWALMAWVGIIRTRTVGLLVASFSLWIGLSEPPESGWRWYVTTATFIGLVAVAVAERSLPLLLAGALVTVSAALSVPSAMLVVIPILVGTAVYIVRRRRVEGRDWLGRHQTPASLNHLAPVKHGSRGQN